MCCTLYARVIDFHTVVLKSIATEMSKEKGAYSFTVISAEAMQDEGIRCQKINVNVIYFMKKILCHLIVCRSNPERWIEATYPKAVE